MRVERGRRAVLRLEVEGSPAQTYSRPGRTTRRTASRTAGTTIQGRRRKPLLGAVARPQPEQYRLSGLSGSPQSGQNELVWLTGYIIPRGSQNYSRWAPRTPFRWASAQRWTSSPGWPGP